MSDLRDEIYDLINVSRYEMAATRDDIIDDILAAFADALTSDAAVDAAGRATRHITDRWVRTDNDSEWLGTAATRFRDEMAHAAITAALDAVGAKGQGE